MSRSIIFILPLIGTICCQGRNQLEFDFPNSSYTHLPHDRQLLRYNLSRGVILDRKQFNNIWVYKNGFVTFGETLEEEDYPIMTGIGQMDQPFENMIGSNIVAIFITANKMEPASTVRIRETSRDAIDSENNKTLTEIEEIIRNVYDSNLIFPVESIVEVEWLKVIPLGFTVPMENSFRLVLLSSPKQTFCLFQYMDIRSLSYKYSGKIFKYQSGLMSYSDLGYVFPAYDATDRTMPLERSSNIGIRNMWMITAGDKSYNIDFGWPTQRKGDVIRRTNVLKSKFRKKGSNPVNELYHTTTTRKNMYSSTDITSYSSHHDTSEMSSDTMEVTPIHQTPEKSSSMDLVSFATKETELLNQISTTATISGDLFTIFELSKVDKERQDSEKSTLYKNTKSVTVDSTIKPTIDQTTRSVDGMPTNTLTRLAMERIVKSSSSRIFSQIKEKDVRQTDPPQIANDSQLSDNKFQSDRRQATPFSAMIKNETTSNLEPLDDVSVILVNDGSRTSPLMDTSSNDIAVSTTEPAVCTSRSCGVNEECFLANTSICCKCQHGTVAMDSRCIDNNITFNMHSKGTAQMSTIGTIWTFDVSLRITKITDSNEQFLRVQMLLTSNGKLGLDIKNFLLLLYPLFHIPMSFYAAGWNGDSVPNISSFVSQEAAINIYVSVGNLEDIYITFKLERLTQTDKWIIALKGIDMKNLKSLNLQDLTFDEKSSEPYNLVYFLLNRNIIEFPEQTVTYQDEVSNRILNIKWRGTMTFSATCLSDYIGNRKYFIKFSDKRYCNSDWTSHNTQIRVMCFGSPHVFDNVPEPCQGNFCGGDKICVNNGHQYDCKCADGFYEVGDQCVKDQFSNYMSQYSTLATAVVPAASTNDNGCSMCSKNANCLIIDRDECCVCHTGHIGSGRSCVQRDSQFEITGLGNILIRQDSLHTPKEKRVSLLFRQWKGEDSRLHHAAFIEINYFDIYTVAEQQLLDFILLLSPLFDVLIGIFATNLNTTHIDNLYVLSKGSLTIKLLVEGNTITPIHMSITINELMQALDIAISVTGIPPQIDSHLIINSRKHFNRRGISNIRYTVSGSSVTFAKHHIKLSDSVNGYDMWWTGSAQLHKCANELHERHFLVYTEPQYDCNVRCSALQCKPYCQTIPILQELASMQKCSLPCDAMARCVNGNCVCQPGYSGNGFICRQILKILECQRSKDCSSIPYTECQKRKCVCKSGFEWLNHKCEVSVACTACSTNEECARGQCVCKPNFVKNRISQKCVFDCSLCDSYSTKCHENGCVCKSGFRFQIESNRNCDLYCESNTDCPTNEICGPSKSCVCPFSKQDGVCYNVPNCNYCHKNASCHQHKCTCQQDWIGDGINCTYNCSSCYDGRYCDLQVGCSCPTGMEGDGRKCQAIPCGNNCPMGAQCHNDHGEYRCVCKSGMLLLDNECTPHTVQLTILPPDETIEAFQGSTVDIICIGSSGNVWLDLYWERQSGHIAQQAQQFVDATNKTLRLRIFSATKQDTDRYSCKTRSGETRSINLVINEVVLLCKDRCSEFAVCDKGKCKCLSSYVGDGIKCALPKICLPECLSSEICNHTIGTCDCRPGHIRYQDNCVADCRKYLNCDRNAHCDQSSGRCQCAKSFIGNGTKCWKATSSCLLTKRCTAHANCTKIPQINQYVCECDAGYVGDGSVVCHEKIDCSTHRCGPRSFCEPTVVRSAHGDVLLNGKCSCEPGYVRVKDKCEEPRKQKTIWMSMGESLISLKIGENVSKIQYIDTPPNNEAAGIITSLTGNCDKQRLIWAGQNGINVKSSQIGTFSRTITHLSHQGKIMGMSTDQDTGNVFFSDSVKRRIGVLSVEKNASRILLETDGYSPGAIVAHSRSGQLFWVVNEYQNNRIESAFMTGENKRVFTMLNNPSVSLVVAYDKSGQNDRLCWLEVNDNYMKYSGTSRTPTMALLKCTTIVQKQPQSITSVHRLLEGEPFSALISANEMFYWSVRHGKYIKSWGPVESKIPIRPNCCDVCIRGMTVLTKTCFTKNVQSNPCSQTAETQKCPELCIPKPNSNGKMEPLCLSSNL